MQILKYDSILLINDFKGDTLIHVYNMKTRQLLRKLIPVGRGPGELRSPLQIYHYKDDLLIYSRQIFTLYSIPFNKIMDGNKQMEKKFKISTDANRLFPLNEHIFISSGYYQKRYALIDWNGEKITEFGEYPDFWYPEKDYPIWARARAHQCRFVKNPANNKFVSYAYNYLDIFDYDDTANTPVLKKRIFFSKYSYVYNELQVKMEGDEPGINIADCSSKYIYLVSIIEDKESSISQIKILDWEGNPIKQLNISKRITCLTIDEKEKKGYVIAQNPDDTLMYFDIEE
jgi:hypothetical protein